MLGRVGDWLDVSLVRGGLASGVLLAVDPETSALLLLQQPQQQVRRAGTDPFHCLCIPVLSLPFRAPQADAPADLDADDDFAFQVIYPAAVSAVCARAASFAETSSMEDAAAMSVACDAPAAAAAAQLLLARRRAAVLQALERVSFCRR